MDRGADGFRIDVSDALIKDDTFPDTATGEPIIPKGDDSPVHDVYREFRRVMDAYPGDRMAVIETGAEDDIVALFIRPDEMHLAFNFRFVHAGFDGPGLRAAIDSSLAANAGVGAPTTWVTDNHDTPRSVSRLGQNAVLTGAYVPGTMASGVFQEVDLELGTRRARALALVLLALPGAAYIYNGQELGLPNVDDLPDDVLQDPIWERSGHTVRGRDGCRVPMPWTTGANLGFTRSRAKPWLPIPKEWAALSVASQRTSGDSMLSLYRSALALRRTSPALGRGELRWVSSPDEAADLIAFDMVGAGGHGPGHPQPVRGGDRPARGRAAAGLGAGGLRPAAGDLRRVGRPAGVRGAPGPARRAGPARRRRDRPAPLTPRAPEPSAPGPEP